jgi:hypothetical protein
MTVSVDELLGEVETVVRERAAAHWLFTRMACAYQTMHGELASRVLAWLSMSMPRFCGTWGLPQPVLRECRWQDG